MSPCKSLSMNAGGGLSYRHWSSLDKVPRCELLLAHVDGDSGDEAGHEADAFSSREQHLAAAQHGDGAGDDAWDLGALCHEGTPQCGASTVRLFLEKSSVICR